MQHCLCITLTYLNISRHCWNDSWEVCRSWLNKYTHSVIGLTPLITFPNSSHMINVVENLPIDRLLLEPDAPYFLPRGGGNGTLLGHTGKFSLPVHVANVAAQVAAIRSCNIEEVGVKSYLVVINCGSGRRVA